MRYQSTWTEVHDLRERPGTNGDTHSTREVSQSQASKSHNIEIHQIVSDNIIRLVTETMTPNMLCDGMGTLMIMILLKLHAICHDMLCPVTGERQTAVITNRYHAEIFHNSQYDTSKKKTKKR